MTVRGRTSRVLAGCGAELVPYGSVANGTASTHIWAPSTDV